MESETPRRFNLVDAMVLLAAFAAGISAFKFSMVASAKEDGYFLAPENDAPQEKMNISPLPETGDAELLFAAPPSPPRDPFAVPKSFEGRQFWIEVIFGATSSFLIILTTAVLLLYLRRPRPYLNNLIHRLGAAACIAALAAFAIEVVTTLAWCAVKISSQSNDFYWPRWTDISQTFIEKASSAVAASWLILGLSRNSARRRLHWLDLLGCFIGIAWITMAFKSAISTAVATLLG